MAKSNTHKPGSASAEETEKPQSAFGGLTPGLQDFLLTAGGIAHFTGKFLTHLFKPPFEWEEMIHQAYRLGYKSLTLVGISGFIIGLVLTMQARPTMVEFGAEFYIPTMVTISIVREIGPVLTAMICAGKLGSGIGAELGSMKVTEQLDAMAVSGVNAFNYTVVTRVLATTLMVPLLVFYADAIGLFGSYFAINLEGEMSLKLFFQKAIGSISYSDIIPATAKSVLFGFAVGIVGCYKGYMAEQGTVGVGYAANSAVVAASFLIFIIDMIAVQLTQLII